MINVPDDASTNAVVRAALSDVGGVWLYGSAAICRAGLEGHLNIGMLAPRGASLR